MSYARNTYTGNGSNTIFDISFPWNTDSPGSVVVEVAGETLAPNTYFFLNSFTQVKLNTAPANGEEVLIYRSTYIAESAVVYSPGSAIIADDLNTSNTQLLWGLQDATDAYQALSDGDSAKISELDDALNQEIQDRTDGDTTLQGNINAEATTRGQADDSLDGRIADEVTARQQGDAALQQQVDGIVSGTDPADKTQIQQNKDDIQTNANNLAAEVGNRITGDSNLYDGLLAEAGTRQNADQNLQDQIDNFSGGGTDPADKTQIQTNTTNIGDISQAIPTPAEGNQTDLQSQVLQLKGEVDLNVNTISIINGIVQETIFPTAIFAINNPAGGDLNQDSIVTYTQLATTDSVGLRTGVSLTSADTITLKSNITGVGPAGRYLIELHTRCLYSFGAGSGTRSLGFYMWDNAAYDYLAKGYAGTAGAATLISCNSAVPSHSTLQTLVVPTADIYLQTYAMRWQASATSFSDAIAEVLPALVPSNPSPAPAAGTGFYTNVDFQGDAWVKITRVPEDS